MQWKSPDSLRRTDRSRLVACIALAALTPNLGCDNCDGHDADEYYCDHDRLLICRWESSGNQPDTLGAMPAGWVLRGPQEGRYLHSSGHILPDCKLGLSMHGRVSHSVFARRAGPRHWSMPRAADREFSHHEGLVELLRDGRR
jgi:hypothetical protein